MLQSSTGCICSTCSKRGAKPHPLPGGCRSDMLGSVMKKTNEVVQTPTISNQQPPTARRSRRAWRHRSVVEGTFIANKSLSPHQCTLEAGIKTLTALLPLKDPNSQLQWPNDQGQLTWSLTAEVNKCTSTWYLLYLYFYTYILIHNTRPGKDVGTILRK